MDESNPKIPTYEALFEVKHNDDQALMLFEDYLCYRSLQDVLSLRTSRWEQLVQSKKNSFVICNQIMLH